MRFGPLGLPEILIILVIVLLIFGPRRLPEMAKGIGQSVREFRKGIRDMKDDIERDDDDNTTAKTKAAGVSTAKAETATPTTPSETSSAEKVAVETAETKPS